MSSLSTVSSADSKGRGRAASGAHLRSLSLRVLSGIVAVPTLLGLAYLGGTVYSVFICLACGYAAFELWGMLRRGGYHPVALALFGTAVLLPLDAWLRPGQEPWSAAQDGLAVVLALGVASLVVLVVGPAAERRLIDWALSLALALYVGGLMQFYFPLRALPTTWPGLWVMALLILSWVCDSSAYFVGGAFGRTPLAPNVSPKKSVEGAIAGLIAPALVGPLLGLAAGVPPLLMAGYGLTIAIATIVGDLIESFVKRQTGVKDSGVLIPGHGGLLDRMDSLLLCAPLAVLYLRAFGL